ncbi:MAG TPA: hydrolase [Streptosporangiaceae bacterium]|nr:hydrolase [Streptosporangiaceae bacterium]
MLTPQNAALVLIDFQDAQVNSIPTPPEDYIPNVVALAEVGLLYDLPIVLSTINHAAGVNGDTIPQLRDVLVGVSAIDRTSINAWEDAEFVAAVRETGRQKLIIAALWTEVCLAFPTLDAIEAGFEVYPVVDAVAGTSQTAHEWALQRMVQAGAQPMSWVSVMCELQRDWNRTDTTQGMLAIALKRGGAFGTEVAIKFDRTTVGA